MKPKPCPFCGSENVQHRSMNLLLETVHCYQCQACGGTGGSTATQIGALNQWNRRTIEQETIQDIITRADFFSGRRS